VPSLTINRKHIYTIMTPEAGLPPLMPKKTLGADSTSPPTARRSRPKSAKPKKRPAHKALTPPQANLCPAGYGLWLSCDWANEEHDIRIWNPTTGTLTAHQVIPIRVQNELIQPLVCRL
jgi:hypothetical protein